MGRETYTAVATRSGGWWAIVVPDVAGVQSQARRLGQVEAMAREAIGLVLDIPEDSFDVRVEAGLDPQVRQVVDLAVSTRHEADEAARRASSAMDDAVRALVGDGLTLRDTGELLHVSYQRIQQIVARATDAISD